MPKTDAIVPGEQHFILSSLPPSGAQKRLALALVLGILAIYFIAVGPLSDIPPYPIAAFIPSYTTAMFVTERAHRDPAVRPVLHPARACHPRDRERIPLHGAYPDPVDPDVSRRVCVERA